SALSDQLAALAPNASLHESGHEPTALVVQAGRHLPPTALAGKRVVAFCGIGNPESFFETLERAGAELAERIAFDDHVAYGPAELGRVATAVTSAGAEAAVTTAKDRVKVAASDLSAPLWTVKVEVRVTAGREELLDKVRTAVGR
ncbi:MAG: tetraacyldisaccharide 4'-kinase, partial [Planctomycetota bacterium]